MEFRLKLFPALKYDLKKEERLIETSTIMIEIKMLATGHLASLRYPVRRLDSLSQQAMRGEASIQVEHPAIRHYDKWTHDSVSSVTPLSRG